MIPYPPNCMRDTSCCLHRSIRTLPQNICRPHMSIHISHLWSIPHLTCHYGWFFSNISQNIRFPNMRPNLFDSFTHRSWGLGRSRNWCAQRTVCLRLCSLNGYPSPWKYWSGRACHSPLSLNRNWSMIAGGRNRMG